MSMDEIVPGLWIGDLQSAMDTEMLKKNNIFSILSAMRGRVTINETFIRHQILLDDTEDEDILIHFLPSITFIQSELDKGRGVLVHCQAGMSRSAAIVAAYLMYTRHLDVEQALEFIRKSRPDTQPNEGFLTQLEVFHQASFKVSRSSKSTRMYYLARTVEEILNGDGSLPSTSMFAKFPRTPTDSLPATPGTMTPIVRRRIRCKMCRQELATREHMLDHGQLNPPTPALSLHQTPAPSRRGSSGVTELNRRSSGGATSASVGSSLIAPLTTSPPLLSTSTTPTTGTTTTTGTSVTTTATPLMRSQSTTIPRSRSRLSSSSSTESSASTSVAGGVGGGVRSRRPSNLLSVGEALSMSAIDPDKGGCGLARSYSVGAGAGAGAAAAARPLVLPDGDQKGVNGDEVGLDTLKLDERGSALDSDDDDPDDDAVRGAGAGGEMEELGSSRQFEVEAARLVGRRMSSALIGHSGNALGGVGGGSGGGLSAVTNGNGDASVSGRSGADMTPVEGESTATPTQEIPDPNANLKVGANGNTNGNGQENGVRKENGNGNGRRATPPTLASLPPMATTTISRAPSMDASTFITASSSISPTTNCNSATNDEAGAPGAGAGSPFVHPHDLAAQLYANPKLAALRSPGVGTPGSPGVLGSTGMSGGGLQSPSMPIIANPKCSGYFVEPMKWMEPFLSSGQLAGKITCPNKKCNAKLGNYDWAGVKCSCKEWVTPGFCIARSKVDEVV